MSSSEIHSIFVVLPKYTLLSPPHSVLVTYIITLQGLACICKQGEALVDDTEQHHRAGGGHSCHTDGVTRGGTALVEGHSHLMGIVVSPDHQTMVF